MPDDAGVRDTLARWTRERELHERMRLEVGDHFTVSFEGAQDAAMASQALDALDRAFWRICDVFGAFGRDAQVAYAASALAAKRLLDEAGGPADI